MSKFNKLLLIEITNQRDSDNRKLGLFVCDCGNKKLISYKKVSKGLTKSCGCLNKKATLESTIKYLYNRYKFKAQKKKLIFELTLEEFKDLTNSNCHYCKTKPSQKAINNNITYFYNGVDRKNNLIGYTLNNSLPCCKICNRAKNSMVYEDFIEYLNRIYNARK